MQPDDYPPCQPPDWVTWFGFGILAGLTFAGFIDAALRMALVTWFVGVLLWCGVPV